METVESSTPAAGDASPLDRLEAMLSADDSPAPSKPQVEATQADVPDSTDEPAKVDAVDEERETPNEYQIADVAKLLGADETALDVDEDGSIMVRTKIDGQEGKVKFADLIKSYQLQGHVDKQVREAAEARKAAQEYVQQAQQQVQVQQAVVGKIAEAKVIETQLAQYQEINWAALEDSDPVQAMRLQRQFGELKQAYQVKVQEVNQAQNYIQQQQSSQAAASLDLERQALKSACPAWNNDAVAAKEKQQITADLLSRGYTQADVQGLSDHKAVLLARDAMLYRQMKAANSTAEKQVRQAPKIVKPGSTGAHSTSAVQKIHQEVRRSGSKQSVMDYLLASGKV